jgi:hypothetical protein
MFTLEPAVIAALIAGLFALLGLIISKESKVSEFRQQWIDSLREDVSTLLSHVEGIRGASVVRMYLHQTIESLWAECKPDMMGVKKKSATIRLRLNPHEAREEERKANEQILDALKKYKEMFDSRDPNFMQLDGINEQLITATQTVLKENWNRVRRGERVYRVTRWLAGFVLIAAVIVLLVHSGLALLHWKISQVHWKIP